MLSRGPGCYILVAPLAQRFGLIGCFPRRRRHGHHAWLTAAGTSPPFLSFFWAAHYACLHLAELSRASLAATVACPAGRRALVPSCRHAHRRACSHAPAPPFPSRVGAAHGLDPGGGHHLAEDLTVSEFSPSVSSPQSGVWQVGPPVPLSATGDQSGVTSLGVRSSLSRVDFQI
jgi:hypothetical protein